MSAPAPAQAQAPSKPADPAVSANLMVGGIGFTITASLGLIFAIVFAYGAAKLSYDKFRSVGWAVLAFIFSSLYYPYYALFHSSAAPLSTPPPMGMLGARRRR
jgi:hypothetical protein